MFKLHLLLATAPAMPRITAWTLGAAIVTACQLWAGSGTAATYYVAKSGSDTNSCDAARTRATARRTLMGTTGGLSCLRAPGDTLLVQPGNYSEVVDSVQGHLPSGTSWSNAIRIAAVEPGTVRVTGFWFGYNSQKTSLPKVSYWIVEGFKVGSEGIRLRRNAERIRFINNEVSWTDESAITLTHETVGHELLNNKVHDARSDCVKGNRFYGVYVGQAHNTLIEGNEFYNMPGGAIQVYNSSIVDQGVVIRNNLIHDNTWCTTATAAITVVNANNARLYNNVLYGNGHALGGNGIYIGQTVNTKVFNNTIFGNKGVGIEIGSLATGADVKNNIVWGNGTRGIFVRPGANAAQDANLCELRCAVTASPGFVGAARADFHLLPTSPAINRGVNLFSADVSFDYDRRQRPRSGMFELGAFEYSPGPVALSVPASPSDFIVR